MSLPRSLRRGARHLVLALCLQGAPLALAAEPAGEHGQKGDAGHGEHHFDPKTFAFQLINFGILVAILGFFGGRAINKALAARHEQLKRDLEEAVQARAAAEARLAQQERRLGNLEKEVTALRASIKEEALGEEKRLVATAEEKARRIQEETKFLMAQEVKQAEIRFREEVAAQAVRIAEEVVQRSVKPEDDKRLSASFVADLEGGSKPATTSQGGGGGKLVGERPGSADEAIS
jgi:F-type H+-transporting ATPase subunit b